MSGTKFIESLDWLGLVDWDLWIRVGLLGGAAMCALCSFIACVNIIREVSREKKEQKCQETQRPRKPNYLISLFFHSIRRNRLLVRDDGDKLTSGCEMNGNKPFIILALHFLKDRLFLLFRVIHRFLFT